MDELRWAVIERWLAKAGNDLHTARTMLTTNPPVPDVVCFHSQQCAEKALKAFLVFADVHVERTHYLRRLVELCSNMDASFVEFFDAAAELSDYAVESRYPDDYREIPLSEAKEAAKKAEDLYAFVRAKLGRIK